MRLAEHFISFLQQIKLIQQYRSMNVLFYLSYDNIYIFKESLKFFATVHNLMKDINMIDSCQAHLDVKYHSNIKFIPQK